MSLHNKAAAKYGTTCIDYKYMDSRWKCGEGHNWTVYCIRDERAGECPECTVACRQCKTVDLRVNYAARGTKRLQTCRPCLAASSAKRERTADAKAAKAARLRPLRPVCAIDEMQEDVLVAIVSEAARLKCRNQWAVARGTCRKILIALDNEARLHLKLESVTRPDLAWFGAGLCRPSPGWRTLETELALPLPCWPGVDSTLADARRASLKLYGSRARMAEFVEKFKRRGGDLSIHIQCHIFELLFLRGDLVV
jgi:hypothetical protein